MQIWFLLVWLLGLTVIFCAAFFVVPRISPGHTVLATALIAVVARVVPIFVYPDSEGLFAIDVDNFERAADAVLHGRNIYLEPSFVHPYLPFQMYILAAMKALADATDTSFFVWMRLPQAAADAGIAVLLVLTTRAVGGGERAAWRNGLLYAVCPLGVATTVYHGQFDAISVLFCLGAFFLLIRGVSRSESDASAIALGLGILQKLWPIFLAPLFLMRLDGWEKRARYAALTGVIVAVPVLLYLVVFDASWNDLYTKVLRYQTPLPRGGGIILVMDRLPEFVPARDAVMDWWIGHGEWPAAVALLVVTAIMIAQGRELLDSVIAVLCTLFVVLPDNGGYHYLWIVPFGLLARHDLPTAIIVLSVTGQYLVLGFLGTGLMYPSKWEGDQATWIIQHQWILAVISWLTLAVWGLWIVLQGTLPFSPASSGSGLLVRAGRTS